MSHVSGANWRRQACILLGVAALGVSWGAAPAWGGGPQWKLIYYRQIGKTVNANNRTIENFLFRENGSKGAAGLTNLSNSGFAIFGNADMNGYIRIPTDLNNFYYDARVYDPGAPTEQSPNFYYQRPPNYYTFETHWLYVSDADKVITYPTQPVYHYDLVNGINAYDGQQVTEPAGYDNSDDFALDLGAPPGQGTSAPYQAQTFVIPPGINRIISAKAFVTREFDVHFQYRATIHQGGPLGAQIGPAAVSQDIASPNFLPITVNWGLQAVPVMPGQMYALKLAPVSGGQFNAFATKTNNYPHGMLFNGTTANPNHDLVAVVVGVRYNDVAADPPVINCSPTSISRSIHRGENLAGENLALANGGGETLNYSISDDMAWLSVNPTNGSSSGEMNNISISYNTADLEIGQHAGVITIMATGASNSPQIIPVTLTVDLPLYAPCDFDQDLDVDMDDFGWFQTCITGPGINQPLSSCTGAKLDDDEDVDALDVDKFRQCLSGAGVPAVPTCAD